MENKSVPNTEQLTNTATPIINFQLGENSISQKSNFSVGKKLAEQIMAYVNGGTSSYFWVRNQRWRTNRNYANGRISMTRFQDLLEFNGKVNYVNLNWQPIHVTNRIISGLVGRWMNKREKINVTATDTLSVTQKQKQFEELEFYVSNKRQLQELEQQSGVPIIPQNQQVPSDEDELKLWQSQIQRLPEEILFELGCNDVLNSNGWEDVLKEKALNDVSITAFLGTYTWMDDEGVIYVESLKPENCVYSYSNFPDFRDTTWRGYLRPMKISELRKKYSKEFHPDNPNALTEEQLFEIAKTSKDYVLYDSVTWQTEWNVSFLRPYDEYNIDVLEFEFKTVDTEKYTVVTTKKNKSTLLKKGVVENRKEANLEVVEDLKINIYRGVYAITNKIMLEWGLKKNMIRPQDPREIGNAEFSYSFYMAQNYDMTCLGVPEKIQEPVDQMIIARLKIQQLVAKMRPAGTAVNWRAVQNIDYGLGDNNKAIDFKKMFDQTGDFYYRDKDVQGNPIGVPFTEIPNAGFLPQLEGLIKLYQFHYSIIKDELGEDPNMIAQALQPRVAAGNVEASQQQAEFATDYYYNAFRNCMADTARKISCLLKNSVVYGSKAYRKIVGEEDLDGRIFSTKIQMLPDTYQIQVFEAMLNQAIQANGDLVLFIDPFQLMRVAREDVKLAELLFRHGQKKMIETQQQIAAQNQQQTIEGQIASAKAAEEEKRATKQLEIDGDVKKSEVAGLANNQSAVINMVANLLKPTAEGVLPSIPAELKPLVDAVVQNVMVSAIASTEEQKEKIVAQIQEAQMQQQQMQKQQGMAQQPEQMEQENIEQQQPEIAA